VPSAIRARMARGEKLFLNKLMLDSWRWQQRTGVAAYQLPKCRLTL
jgi:hypothetical protein